MFIMVRTTEITSLLILTSIIKCSTSAPLSNIYERVWYKIFAWLLKNVFFTRGRAGGYKSDKTVQPVQSFLWNILYESSSNDFCIKQ